MVPVIFPSAAAFWLCFHSELDMDIYSPDRRHSVSLPRIYALGIDPDQMSELSELVESYLPVTVLSPPDTRRYINNRYLKAMKYPVHMPDAGLIKVGQHIYMATPELCFLQAANHLSFPRLILFGNDLCGQYAYSEMSAFRQRHRNPVATVQSIQEFLNRSAGCYGHRKALRAANYLMDHSNSPIESMLALFSELPAYMGGYALKRPRLNQQLLLSEDGNRVMRGHACYGDMVWEEEKLVLEYDSDISHLTSAQHHKDKQRSSAMAVSGYRTVSITRQNVSTLSELDKTFRLLRKLLGMRSNDEALRRYSYMRRKNLDDIRHFQSYNPNTYFASG